MKNTPTLNSAAVEQWAPEWYRPFERSDKVFIGLLAILPWLLFGIPTLLGHPALAGDNLIQNYPLRVLSGQILQTGHLPLLNVYANSGTPLLGAMNAGSLYPLTVIFAFLPGPLAWLINLFAVYFVAGLGMYSLARWFGFSPTSSVVSALFYGYAGAMMGQMVHLGVVQGYSFLPWLVLVMLAWQRNLSVYLEPTWGLLARVSIRWILALSGIWGLTFLTGEPRAIAEIELVFLILLGAAMVLRSDWALPSVRHRIALAVGSLMALGWGVGIGLVQMLPGWDFIGLSQRASLNYWFFGSGSLALRRTGLLWFPTLLGGNGSFGQPGYYADYNLPEVTSYVGLLALFATALFFSRLRLRGWRDGERNFAVFAVLAIIGLFATWGSFTPLGHLFRLIPLFGSTRLQSRNIVMVDLALSFFLAWLLEEVRLGRWRADELSRRSKMSVIGVSVVVVGTVVGLWLGGTHAALWLGAVPRSAHLINLQWPVFILYGALAVLFAGLLLTKISPHRFRLLVSLATVDLALFLALGQTGVYLTTGTVANHPITAEPSHTTISKLIGPVAGRTAILDRFGANETEVEQIGLPNLNVFTGFPSVQGYGSLINDHYSLLTGTHPRAMFDVCAFKAGVFKQLDLSTVIVNTAALADHNTPQHKPERVCGSDPYSSSAYRFWGQPLSVDNFRLVTSEEPTALGGKEFYGQLLDAQAHLTGKAVIGAKSGAMYTFDFGGQHLVSYGILVTSLTPFRISDAKVFSANRGSFDLVTPFQDAITALSSEWSLSGTVGGLSVFRSSSKFEPTALVGNVGKSLLVSTQGSVWGDELDVVHATKYVTLTRSMAYLPGWRVTALNLQTHKTENLPVFRRGLILSTRVPTGRWSIHWHYHAPYIELGAISTLLTGIAWIFAAIYTLTGVLTKRRTRVES
jgi:hypothetical protein